MRKSTICLCDKHRPRLGVLPHMLISVFVFQCLLDSIFLHEKGKSNVLPWVAIFISHIISPKVHVLFPNIGCVGHHVTSL